MKKLKYTPLQIAVHIGAWIPLAWLIWAYNAHRLTVNPIQNATQRTGRYALILLVLCLAVTPLNTVLGWRGVVRVKRALGMYSFMYALIHVLILSGVDYSFNFNYLWGDFSGKQYIWVGLAGFLCLGQKRRYFPPAGRYPPAAHIWFVGDLAVGATGSAGGAGDQTPARPPEPLLQPARFSVLAGALPPC
jgi:hypothetical protein